jgi:hypothetical protein
MKNENEEKNKIEITENEENIIYFLTAEPHEQDANSLVINIFKHKELDDFVSRNFGRDIDALQKWILANYTVKTIASNSGTFTCDLNDLEYELGENESIEDVDWDDIARNEINNGMYGEFQGDYDSIETSMLINLDTSKCLKINEQKEVS